VRKIMIGLAAVMLVAAVGGVALATIPSANGVIHACYVKRTGALRVVSGKHRCPAGQAPLHWNVRGPRGPQGPGADLLRFMSDGTNGAFTVIRTVAGYAFEGFCNINPNGSVTTKLHYIVPDGVTTSEAGTAISSTSTDPFHVSGFSGDVNLEELTTPTSADNVLDYTIVGSNGKSVQLFVTVSADSNPTPPDTHCEVTGNVTPLS
jgi:hypothetical protein